MRHSKIWKCRNLVVYLYKSEGCVLKDTPLTILINMTQFKWTDASAKAFTQVYSSNFDSKCIPSWFRGSYSDYIGKKMDEKLEQFKSDWVRSESQKELVLCLEDSEDLTLRIVDGKLLITRS